MAKYRKKPVVIEAWENIENSPMPDWLKGRGEGVSGYAIFIRTEEGIMKASPGDYVILGVKGEVYPCKPDIFEATYEIVE